MKENFRIFVDCGSENGPVQKAIEAVARTLFEAEIVKNQEVANLVVIDKITKIASSYQEDKQYMVIQLSGQLITTEKSNVTITAISNITKTLWSIMSTIESKSAEIMVKTVVESSTEKPNAEWILVVDDKPENRQAAIDQLNKDFNVVVANGFDQGRKIMETRSFDFALLDLNMPVDTSGALGEEAIANNLGKDIPYGMFLLLSGCFNGAHSAVVTDLNHHKDPFSAAFDHYSSKKFEINGKKAIMLHAQMINGVKDWTWALQQLKK